MSTIIQYMRITEGFNKETIPTTWGTDWYNLWCSQSLHHTLDPTRHNKIILKTWEGNHNEQIIEDYKVLGKSQEIQKKKIR